MNKKSFIIIFFLLLTPSIYGQQKDDAGVYLNAEKMPAIQGGMSAIGKKIRYPKIAKEMGIQGVVYVGFIVDEYGKVKEPKVLRSLAVPLDKEAIRVLEEDIKFTPGYHQGTAVPGRMVLPIRFRM